MSCEQIQPGVDNDASFVVDGLPRIEDTAPATDLIVLIAHLFWGDRLWKCFV